jgi:hypothetical protein
VSINSTSKSGGEGSLPPSQRALARQMLPMSATIPPGATARIIAKPRTEFRAERLLISPHSFPLSRARRVWTWPLVTIGRALGRVHRGLAKLLHVDLYASHEQREYVSDDYEETYAGELFWDDDEDRYFILIPTPLNRRERLLAPLGRTSGRFSRIRLSWQEAQLSTVFVCNVTISKRPQFVDGAPPLPGDMFASRAIDTFVEFNTAPCMVGHEIEIEVHNGNRRECRLMMSLIGIGKDVRSMDE